jgi:2-polyprenyl-6-methoxyphenol hydroxylase-like FAD-dependent oxidoreductase
VRFLAQIHDAPYAPLDPHPTTEQLHPIVDSRVGRVTITTPHRLSRFEIHHGQVPAYRAGRVFLAGDAAHIPDRNDDRPWPDVRHAAERRCS